MASTTAAMTQEAENVTHYASLLQNHHSKTLDVGLNGHTMSTGRLGDILQLSCFHPVHGMVVASPFAQFDGNRFRDSGYVREYRAAMLDCVRSGTQGFGLRINGNPSKLSVNFVNNQSILITYMVEDFQVSTTLSIGLDGEAVQTTQVKSRSETAKDLGYTLELNVSVNRASYGQLTEGGPIPIPPSMNVLQLFEHRCSWAVVNPNLGALVEGSLSCDSKPVTLDAGIQEETVFDQPTRAKFCGSIHVLPSECRTFISTYHLRPGTHPAKEIDIPSSIPTSSRGRWKLQSNEVGLIIKRNLEYILGNCAIPVSQTSTCFIADHVALPLGWNRDNYWQIRYLLDVYRNLDRIAYPETALTYASQIRRSVRNHLNWVFRVAQRPYGYWHRSYLVSGVPKDGPIFQQDQQCYPLLELCDFFDTFPSDRAFVKELLSEKTVPFILNMLQSHQDPKTGLYATEETPGDDEVEYPFHFSSHVLLWHTIMRLSDVVKNLAGNPELNYHGLQAQASKIRKTTLHHFVASNPKTSSTMFAYLTDGAGQHVFYHDANDIPTLFIKDWSFSTTVEEHGLWARTMDFGLSSANEGGFYPAGPFGGLGSVHTRGPWPLGFAQEFVYAHLKGDELARKDAWRRIMGSMFWDGLFAEAVDPQTGDCTSKAWFSWPGSMIGSALLRFSLETL